MQVYADLRIITARPTPDEEARVPHLLFGHVDAAENYSVGHYVADAAAALAAVWAAGRVPIVTGGTGLYFKALTEGLSEIPAVPAEVRAAIRAMAEGRDAAALHGELARRDPDAAAGVSPNDRLRVLRALEVLAATGQSIVSFRGRKRPGPLAGVPAVRLFLAPDRKDLYARIDARFDAMMAAGALGEVRVLAARGLDPRLPAMRAHGVPWLVRHLAGEITLAEAIAGGQADTRHYAKRQFTWFRHQLADFAWVAPEAARERIAADWPAGHFAARMNNS